jgi:preprotein translocase subunit SecE
MFDKLVTFLKEVSLEIKKVNWPTREETIKYTLMVIAVSLALAIFLGGFDFLFTTLLNWFIIK